MHAGIKVNPCQLKGPLVAFAGATVKEPCDVPIVKSRRLIWR